MPSKEDRILARELGKIGGPGSSLVACFLPNDVFELTVETPLPPGPALEVAYSILSREGEIVKDRRSAPDAPEVWAVVGSGTWGLNPALVKVRAVSTTGALTTLSVVGIAKEGLIKQHAGEKAARRIADLLAGALSHVSEGRIGMKTVVTFGEIMLRLSPPGFQRFVQARSFDVTFGGGEANVAASLANYGQPVEYVTRLPANEIGDACLNFLRQYGIGTRHIVRGGERLGIYFLETGAAQRGSKVIYDRAGSGLATIQPGMIDWRMVFADADWFHWTGITPAISEGAAAVCLEAAQIAREMGLTVSCDLNYRKNLWKWGKKASEVMPDLVSLCDVAVGNEEDAEKVFGIKAPGADVIGGKVEAAAYVAVCEQLAARFPNLKTIAITLRGSLSATHNTWSGMLWQGGQVYTAPVYDITTIVDRVGGGDAFCGGLIYGLRVYDDPQRALDFAVAASCLKHSIPGDFNLVSVAEVEKLMGGDVSGRVSR